ncbi:MAG: hypothetical protein AB1427_08680 [Thermodesulfobacteriota bacterium]
MTRISISDGLMGEFCCEMNKLELLKALFSERAQEPMFNGDSGEMNGGIFGVLNDVTKSFATLHKSIGERLCHCGEPEKPETKPEYLPKENALHSIKALLGAMNPSDLPAVLEALQAKVSGPTSKDKTPAESISAVAA